MLVGTTSNTVEGIEGTIPVLGLSVCSVQALVLLSRCWKVYWRCSAEWRGGDLLRFCVVLSYLLPSS